MADKKTSIFLDELLKQYERDKDKDLLFGKDKEIRIPIITTRVEITKDGRLVKSETIKTTPMFVAEIAEKYGPGVPYPKRYYTGIGSRETPLETQVFMRFLAWRLAQNGWVLRSGGAEGADSAFEEGCDDAGGEKEIYLPWVGFNNSKSRRYALPAKAEKIAKEHHPAWDRLSPAAKKLHTRNVRQIFGVAMESPKFPDFVVCWTKDGKHRGGTGQAIRIAEAYGVPVFDLGCTYKDHEEICGAAMERLSHFLHLDLRVEFKAWRS